MKCAVNDEQNSRRFFKFISNRSTLTKYNMPRFCINIWIIECPNYFFSPNIFPVLSVSIFLLYSVLFSTLLSIWRTKVRNRSTHRSPKFKFMVKKTNVQNAPLRIYCTHKCTAQWGLTEVKVTKLTYLPYEKYFKLENGQPDFNDLGRKCHQKENRKKLEGTHRIANPCRIAVALTLTLICDLEFWNPKTMSFVGYSKVIPYTKFRFWVLFRTNRQTNRQQTDGLEHPYPHRPAMSAWVISFRFSVNCVMTGAYRFGHCYWWTHLLYLSLHFIMFK